MAKDKPNVVLNDRLDEMVDAGMRVTHQWESMWQESLRYMFSDQLRQHKVRHSEWDWIVINYIWPSVIQEVAKLAKKHPRIIVNPREPSDIEGAEAWEGTFQFLWERKLGMRLEQIAAIFDGKLYGYRVSHPYWEPKDHWDDRPGHKRWVGDIAHQLVRPEFFWTEPGAEKVNTARNLGTQRMVSLEWAVARWPRYKKELEEAAGATKAKMGGGIFEGIDYNVTDSSGREKKEPARPTLLLSILQSQHQEQGGEGRTDDKKKLVEIEDIYFRDEQEQERIDREDELQADLLAQGRIFEGPDGRIFDSDSRKPLKTGEWPSIITRQWMEPLYPYGRNVLCVGKTILNPDKADQRYPYRDWPYVVTPHYLLPHMWQGIDAVQMTKTAQDMINISISYLVNHVKMHGDPQWAVENDALADDPRTKKAYRISSVAGKLIRLAKGGLKRIQRHDPPPVSQGVIMLYQIMSQEYKNLSGLQAIARGEQPKSRTTATEAQHLALSSNDRVALQGVYEDKWVKQVVERMAEIVQKNYDLDRYVRIIGADSVVGATQISQGMKDAYFDIDIEAGSTQPFDEQKRLEKYVQVYQMLGEPVANPFLPEMLRIFEIPRWQQVLQRHAGWLEFVKFLQMREAVKAGEIDPRQALAVIAQELGSIAPVAEPEGAQQPSA